MRKCLPAGVPPMTAASNPPAAPSGGWSTAGCEFSRPPQRMAMGDTTMLVTPPELADAMARIEKAGQTDHADSFAGLEVDQEQVRAIVYRVPSAAFDDFLRSTGENTCITVHDAAHTLAELTTWQTRLTADLTSWEAAGVRIITLAVRPDGAGVELGVESVSTAKDQLLTRYGPDAPLIVVEQGPVTTLASPADRAAQ